MLKTTIGRLRIVGIAEGVSFLLLLFVAMPLKYTGVYEQATQVPGMLHGILFVLYVLLVLQVRAEYGWNMKKTMLALVASVLPFGTFYADAKLFKTPTKQNI